MQITIDDLIGKPYIKDGRGPSAYDCIGLGLEIDKRRGIYIPDYQIPSDRDERYELLMFVKDSFFKRLSGPEPWCWVLFRFIDDKANIKWHSGKVLPDCLSFIHIRIKTCVCINRLNELFYHESFEGYYESRYAR